MARLRDCKFFNKETCSITSNLCASNDDCYFKQLLKVQDELIEYKRYKFLFEKAKEFKEESDRYAARVHKENERLKDDLKRTICQAECFRYKQMLRLRETLTKIQGDIERVLEDNAG